MILVQETTDWTTPNHVYLLDDSRQYMHGYIKRGAADLQMFKAPIRFSTRGRSFHFIRSYNGETQDDAKHIVSVQVEGSRGDKYTVILQDNEITCDCTGFKYRAECRHIPLARELLLYL
jgi:hypothetical protein